MRFLYIFPGSDKEARAIGPSNVTWQTTRVYGFLHKGHSPQIKRLAGPDVARASIPSGVWRNLQSILDVWAQSQLHQKR